MPDMDKLAEKLGVEPNDIPEHESEQPMNVEEIEVINYGDSE